MVLYRFGGSPLPGHVAGWHHIATVLSSRDDGSLLLGIIRGCSWLAWLLFTVCVLAEAQAAIRGRRSPYLRLGGLQGAAAHLVALAALAFATPSAITLSASVATVSQPGWSELREFATMTASQPHAAPGTGGRLSAPQEPGGTLDAHAAKASRLVIVRAATACGHLPSAISAPATGIRRSSPELRPRHGRRPGFYQPLADRAGLAASSCPPAQLQAAGHQSGSAASISVTPHGLPTTAVGTRPPETRAAHAHAAHQAGNGSAPRLASARVGRSTRRRRRDFRRAPLPGAARHRPGRLPDRCQY